VSIQTPKKKINNTRQNRTETDPQSERRGPIELTDLSSTDANAFMKKQQQKKRANSRAPHVGIERKRITGL